MTRVAMSVLVLVTTLAIVFGFLSSDQTPRMLIKFIALYLVGVVWPAVWTFQLHRALHPSDRRTQSLAWSPVIVGSTTILVGLATFM